ncbi:hypothetical protein V502_08272 [Pseudogymnoascus sp. VKM F-4520 (FW-2644)]|nr:hypothetical protein V502_08272 [Pseudogymnoascus sp. VKM F-4520 (FW-2644)]
MLRYLSLSSSTKSRILSQRRKIRYLVLTIILIVLFFTFPYESVSHERSRERPRERPSPTAAPTEKRQYNIQATFPSEYPATKDLRLQRREEVKDAFKHAWKGYKKHAWLHDEVMPLSGGHKDPFAGWAATIVDGLDTLYIMGMIDEFEDALKALEKINFSKPNAERVPVFEVTIRYLGGLLGAWDISGHKYPILLKKATELGDFLYGAFNTESGIPVPYYWWEREVDGLLKGDNGVLVAQIASLSLELIRLSQVTGNPKYADAVQKVTDQLDNMQTKSSLPGMWPSQVDCKGPKLAFSTSSYTLGAFADSAYEYLPKTHLLVRSSTSSEQYLNMYRTALPTFSKNLFFRPKLPGNPDILFSGSYNANSILARLTTEVQHLACFVGGMVGLGSRISNSDDELEMAKKLTDGCVWAYENTPSGIMPEIFHVDKCDNPTACNWTKEGNGFRTVDDSSYQLRPEAIESVFIMYRLTADPSWQDKGWKMFQAITKHTRTDIAHARLKNVMDANPTKEDSMESFWLAETLKYFYLLYSEPELVSLDEYVLNTEAHPFRYG